MLRSYVQSPQEMSRGRRVFVLVICCMSLLIVAIDLTIVNVALPDIHRDLHASVSGLQWVVDAYTLVLASLLVLSGSTADRIGRKRTFRLGLLIFIIGSVACAVAPSLGILIGARVLQAVGGSMLNPVAISIIRNVFNDPKERAQAFGVWSATVGVSMALGPVLGGLLVDSVGWRYVFLVNVPVGLIALMLTTMFVPESKTNRPRRLDPIGQILVIVGLTALVYGIIQGASSSYTSAEIISIFMVALLALVGLITYELRHPEPLIEIRFFRSAPFSGATLVAVMAYGVMGGFLFLNTLYLQDVRGYSALHAGAMTLPIAIMTVLLAPVSGHFVGRGRDGARIPLAVTGVGVAVGAGLLTQLTSTTHVWYILLAYFIFGTGIGMVNPPITNTAVSGMPPEQSGVAAALASTSRQVGATMGIAVLGALAQAGGVSTYSPRFAQATHACWWIVVGLGVAITVAGVVMTSAWAIETARATARRLHEPLVAP